MAYSLGIWADRAVPGGTLYRWEADQGQGGSGFLVVDFPSRTVRPSDRNGTALGDLVLDGESGMVSGGTEGISPGLFLKVAAAILKAFAKDDRIPRTAHTYYA